MNKLFLAGCVFFFGSMGAVSSHADVITIDNTTEVDAFNGTSPYNSYFAGNQPWGDYVGTGYDTTELVVSRQSNSIDFQFHTELNGPDTTYTQQYGVTVSYADIFLMPTTTAAPPANWLGGYAITLGAQGANGGYSTAGFYAIGNQAGDYKTSQDIWSSRTDFIYGGRYAPQGQTGAPQLSPTVLANTTANQLMSGWTVEVSPYNATTGILDVSLTAPNAALFAQLFDNFDLFWGTGDCSNGPLFTFVDGPTTPVPEPSAAALMGSALLAFLFLRRQRRSGSQR